jgi:ABC-type lipoprotein export system ATPase subunit
MYLKLLIILFLSIPLLILDILVISGDLIFSNIILFLIFRIIFGFIFKYVLNYVIQSFKIELALNSINIFLNESKFKQKKIHGLVSRILSDNNTIVNSYYNSLINLVNDIISLIILLFYIKVDLKIFTFKSFFYVLVFFFILLIVSRFSKYFSNQVSITTKLLSDKIKSIEDNFSFYIKKEPNKWINLEIKKLFYKSSFYLSFSLLLTQIFSIFIEFSPIILSIFYLKSNNLIYDKNLLISSTLLGLRSVTIFQRVINYIPAFIIGNSYLNVSSKNYDTSSIYNSKIDFIKFTNTLNSNSNLLITGPSGIGKSYSLRKFSCEFDNVIYISQDIFLSFNNMQDFVNAFNIKLNSIDKIKLDFEYFEIHDLFDKDWKNTSGGEKLRINIILFSNTNFNCFIIDEGLNSLPDIFYSKIFSFLVSRNIKFIIVMHNFQNFENYDNIFNIKKINITDFLINV